MRHTRQAEGWVEFPPGWRVEVEGKLPGAGYQTLPTKARQTRNGRLNPCSRTAVVPAAVPVAAVRFGMLPRLTRCTGIDRRDRSTVLACRADRSVAWHRSDTDPMGMTCSESRDRPRHRRRY